MSQQKRLTLVLGLNMLMIAGLLIVGLTSRSLGVLAAGGDYAADSIAILLGIMAIQIAKHPDGHPKATTYVAGINGVVLLVVTGIVLVGGMRRLITHTPAIHGFSVLVVSLVSMVSMLVAALILGKDAGKEDLHMRSVLLDTIADAAAAAGVAISGATIYLSGRLYWLDSAVALVIGIVIGFGAIRLLRDVISALRDGTNLGVADDH